MNARSNLREPGHNVVSRVLRTAVPIAVSAGLVLWLFHKVDFRNVEHIIRGGVDWRYIAAMMAITVLSHMIRGIRWGIQLRAVGIPRMPVMAESVSIFGAYALNLVFPFLGEGWRCVYVARREQAKLATVVGTDIGDRASDGIMILALMVLTAFVARPYMVRFIDRYSIGRTLDRFLTDPLTWITAVIVIVLGVAVCYYCRHERFMQSFLTGCRRMWQGFRVLFTMKGIGLYVVLTFGIWTCYFLETYVCFFAFPFTRQLIESPQYHLGLIPGLVVFVFGSCSMIVPSNGGLGPWNIAVMFALSLFGISDADGTAYSLVCWSCQAIILIACGVYSAFYIVLTRRRSPAPTPSATLPGADS